MPLYEYKCRQCQQRLEKIQSFNAPPEKVCPHCGGELERVISAPALQFKGAGWYVNDYAKSGGKSKAADGAENKTESKPDAGSEKSESKSDGGAKSSTDSAAASASSSASSSSASETSGSASTAKPAAAK